MRAILPATHLRVQPSQGSSLVRAIRNDRSPIETPRIELSAAELEPMRQSNAAISTVTYAVIIAIAIFASGFLLGQTVQQSIMDARTWEIDRRV